MEMNLHDMMTEEQRSELRNAVRAANEAAERGSNDAEIAALSDALDTALAILGFDRDEEE